MRKSMSTSRSRFLRGGLAAAAVTATVLAATAAPSFATASVVLVPTTAVVGTAGTIAATGTGLFATGTGAIGSYFSINACPATYSTTAPTGGMLASAVKTGTDGATITLPAGLIPNTYNVCLYATATAGALLANTNSPTYTVTTAAPTLNPVSGVPGAVATITATGTTSYLTNGTAPLGVNFSESACASTYTSPAATGLFTATAAKTSATVATITTPTGLLAGTNYNVCIFAGTISGTSKLLGETMYNATAPVITSNVSTGPSAGGNSITVAATTGIFSGLTTVGVVFASTCAPLYSATLPDVTAVATPSSTTLATLTVPIGVVVAGNPYSICLYNGATDATSTLIGATAAASYVAALPVITLSVTTGATGGLNTITGQASANFLASIPAPGVAFVSGPSCPTVYTSAVNLTATGQRIAPNRFAVTVPTAVTSPTSYKVCVYDGTTFASSALLAAAPSYTATAATSITAISPAAGAAQGGSVVTISGSGLPTTIVSAAIGGVPLTSISPTVAGTSFTAVLPAHVAATNLSLSVVTSSGTFILRNAFTYTNGIQVSPNTAPKTSSSVNIYVVGAGFTTPSFNATLADAHIYLVDGVYNATNNGGNKTNGPVTECTNVIVITDTELICKMQLDRRLGADGLLAVVTPRVVTDGVSVVGTTFTSATADFTSADVGLGLSVGSNTEVPAGTTIVSVTSPTTVVLSQAGTAANTGLTTTIGAARVVSAITTASLSTTVTGVAGKFQAADVGRPITGAGIPTATTIVSVATNGASAVLSKAATASAAVPVTVFAFAGVPDGAYTMTFVTDGAVDAATLDAQNYSQSIITSGSTFTVSSY